MRYITLKQSLKNLIAISLRKVFYLFNQNVVSLVRLRYRSPKGTTKKNIKRTEYNLQYFLILKEKHQTNSSRSADQISISR